LNSRISIFLDRLRASPAVVLQLARGLQRHWLSFGVPTLLIAAYLGLYIFPMHEADRLREKCPIICDYDKERDILQHENQVRGTNGAILGGIVLLLSAIAAWRNVMQQREGQITSRFTDAIEQLGATHKDSGKPVIEVRMGGIFALEQIARDWPEKYHRQVFEVLTAYVRENAPLGIGLEKPREDIQAVLTAIGRRQAWFDQEPGRLNLSRTELRRVDLRDANIAHADLRGAVLEHADCRRANLYDANLEDARLGRADLRDALLQSANLIDAQVGPSALLQGAQLQGATFLRASLLQSRFDRAQLDSAIFNEVQLDGSRLNKVRANKTTFVRAQLRRTWFVNAVLHHTRFDRAVLDGANFQHSDLRHAHFEHASLKGASFNGARLQETRLLGVDGLTRSELCSADFDETTTLPDGEAGRTKHQVCVEKVPVPGLIDD